MEERSRDHVVEQTTFSDSGHQFSSATVTSEAPCLVGSSPLFSLADDSGQGHHLAARLPAPPVQPLSISTNLCDYDNSSAVFPSSGCPNLSAGAAQHDQRRVPSFLLQRPDSYSLRPSLPLSQSPKRTLSFDFSTAMSPKRPASFERQIVQLEAGVSGDVRTVDGQRQQEERIPVLQLLDPPKAKLKRQLSADSSQATWQPLLPQDLRSSNLRQSDRLQTHQLTGLGLQQLDLRQNSDLVATGAHSPKRLKSDHESSFCMAPNSPLKKHGSKDSRTSSGDIRTGQSPTSPRPIIRRSRNEDVVHIFPHPEEDKLEGDHENNNNNSAVSESYKRQPNQPVSTLSPKRYGEGDDGDSDQSKRYKRICSKITRSPTSQTDVASTAPSRAPQQGGPALSSASAKPHESLKKLHMLFNLEKTSPCQKDDVVSCKSQHSQSGSTFDIELSPSQSIADRLKYNNQTNSEHYPDVNQAAPVLPYSQSTGSHANPAGCDIPDTQADYIARMNRLLHEMQCRIFADDEFSSGSFFLHPNSSSDSMDHNSVVEEKHTSSESYADDAFVGDGKEKSTKESSREKSSTDKYVKSEGICPKKDFASDMPRTMPTTSTGSFMRQSMTGRQQEEENSRTAHLCLSRENPFKFSSPVMEGKNRCAHFHGEACSKTLKHKQENKSECGLAYSDTMTAEMVIPSAGQFLSKESQAGDNLRHHRQFSDPGSTFLVKPTAKETSKSTVLRQFSEPTASPEQLKPNSTKALSNYSCAENARPEPFGFQQSHFVSLVDEDFPRPVPGQRGYDSGWPQMKPGRRNFPDFSQQGRSVQDMDYSELDRPRGRRESPSWSFLQRSPESLLRTAEATGKQERHVLEDDSVFEDPASEATAAYSFKSPAPVSMGYAYFGEHSKSKSSTPKRPTLRSHSNVEQSPNQAELDAMAQFKFLRSFSEHICDPQRLMEQLKAMPPADYDQLMEQLETMCRVTPEFSFGEDRKERFRQTSCCDGRRNVRRTLFPGGTAVVLVANDREKRQVALQSLQLNMASVQEKAQEGRQSQSNIQQRMEDRTWHRLFAGRLGLTPCRRQSFSSDRDLHLWRTWARADSSQHRARQAGDIDVRIQCSKATSTTCDSSEEQARRPQGDLRMKVENCIHRILQHHLQTRPQPGCSQEDMDQWIAQATEIEQLTLEASGLINSLSEHNRTVFDVTTGSVDIKVNCSSLLGVLDLWQSYVSGELLGLVNDAFGGQKLLQYTGVELLVSVCYLQYIKCVDELGADLVAAGASSGGTRSGFDTWSDTGQDYLQKQDSELSVGNLAAFASPSPASPRLSQLDSHKTSEQTVSPAWGGLSPSKLARREGVFTYADTSPRKAFSQLNLSDGELTPTSPGKTGFGAFHKENTRSSPLASPRGGARSRQAPDRGIVDENSEN